MTTDYLLMLCLMFAAGSFATAALGMGYFCVRRLFGRHNLHRD